MKIIQCSVIKNAIIRNFDGGIDSLFRHTADEVDGYVVGVDDSSTDNTYDAAGKVLDGIGKPFELYSFAWPDDYGAAYNDAFGRADAMGAGCYIRMDDDCRLLDARGIRNSIQKRIDEGRETIRIASNKAIRLSTPH